MCGQQGETWFRSSTPIVRRRRERDRDSEKQKETKTTHPTMEKEKMGGKKSGERASETKRYRRAEKLNKRVRD